MTVRELIEQLEQFGDQDMEVVYGYTEYDSIQNSETYLWAIDNPYVDIKNGERVVNIGSPSDNE